MQICSQNPTAQNQGLSEPRDRSKWGTNTSDHLSIQSGLQKHILNTCAEKLKSISLRSRMFGAELFVLVKNRKQSNCPW